MTISGIADSAYGGRLRIQKVMMLEARAGFVPSTVSSP